MQKKSADLQEGVARSVTQNELQENGAISVDDQEERVENTSGQLSVDEIIALEISRNRGALRRTVSQRAKAGIPVVGRQAQSKGTPVLEKSRGLTEAQINQLARVGVSILFLVIAVVFAWYVLLPEVENSPATPYQGMKEEARKEKYRKLFGIDPEGEDASPIQKEQDLFDKSMTMGQDESGLFQKNTVLSEPSVGNDGLANSNGLVVIPSEEELENMSASEKRHFVKRVLKQMEAQVEDIQQRALIKYSSEVSVKSKTVAEGVPADTVNASFNSWADEGKGTYKDLLQLLNLKHKRLEASKKVQASSFVEVSKQSDSQFSQTTSPYNQLVVEEVVQNVEKKRVATDSVVLITMEGEAEKVCADSIKQKSIEAEKVLASAIAHEMKIIKVDVPESFGEIPYKYAKNIEGLLTTHTIKHGETLSSLSRLYYNHIKYSSYIYVFNRDVIVNKDILPVGLKLDIPQIKDVQVADVKNRNK